MNLAELSQASIGRNRRLTGDDDTKSEGSEATGRLLGQDLLNEIRCVCDAPNCRGFIKI